VADLAFAENAYAEENRVAIAIGLAVDDLQAIA
jgi:hypothetical protein